MSGEALPCWLELDGPMRSCGVTLLVSGVMSVAEAR